MTERSHSGRGAGPWLAFATCCAIWGSTFLFIRIGNDTTPPVWGAGVRLALAAVAFALLAAAVRAPWPRGAELRAALMFGAVDFGVSLPLLYWGEQRIPSGVAAVIYSTIPLTTALFARAAGLESLRPRIVVASLVAVAGVGLLFSSSLGGNTYEPARLLAVVLGALTASLAGVLLKRAPGGHPLATNAWAHGIGALMCVAASRGLGEPQALPQGAAWVAIAYLTVAGSLVAFGTFTWLLQRWSATRSSFIAVVIPVAALLLGVSVRHERPGRTAWLGSVIVFAAVVTGVLGDAAASARDAPRREHLA